MKNYPKVCSLQIPYFHKALFGLALVLVLAGCTEQASNIQLPPLFSESMVVQRDTIMSIWGWAEPGTSIAIETSWGENTNIKAGGGGKWFGNLPTPAAGGPFSIKVDAQDTSITVADVYSGEVWLASGQSNMEMPLKGWPPNDPIKDSEEEIASADFQQIRMFTIPRSISDEPLQQLNGRWNVTTPENAADFSATAYFFARTLHLELGVPVGIIHSSWGGTPAESWTSKETLITLPDFSGVVEKLVEERPARAAYSEWLESLPKTATSDLESAEQWKSLDFGDSAFRKEDYDDDRWRVMQLPLSWEQSDLGNFDGVVWFRKTFMLDELRQDVLLELGAIDDRDQTYVNGILVGEHMEAGQWRIERTYNIPDGILRKGENTIAVRVFDTGGGGGIYSAERGLRITSSSGNAFDLSGSWKYKPVADYRGGTLYAFTDQDLARQPELVTDLNSHTPSVLYNAMINPVVPYTIKGAIWYQGESNVGRAEQYERLFPAMITDWRSKWGYPFAFYFVQIAPFQYGNDKSMELRDAQRKTLTLEHTGMAVTLDIGNNSNIHPANKQDVGERLALWALAKDYGKSIAYSGPLVSSAS